jgi:HK97 family phage major capsid protein
MNRLKTPTPGRERPEEVPEDVFDPHGYFRADSAIRERYELVQKMTSLVDKAEKESRGLSATENIEFRKAEQRVAEIDTTLAKWEAGEKVEQFESRGRALSHGSHNEPRDARTLGEWMNAEFRSLVEGSGSGAVFVPIHFLNTVWDLLAAKSVGLRSGFSVIDSERDEVKIPHSTGDPTAAFVNEATAITESDPSAAYVTAIPRKLAALTAFSNEVLSDSNPAILDVVAGQMFRSLGLAADLAFYEGDGVAPNLKGLANLTGRQTLDLGTDGATLASVGVDPFADAIGLLEEANATATAIVMTPRDWRALLKVKELTTGSNKPLLAESAGSPTGGIQRSIFGIPVYLSSQLATDLTHGGASDASRAFVYQASEVLVVRRQETRLELDRSRLFNQDMSELRGILRLDMVVPNPTAVVEIQGIIP